MALEFRIIIVLETNTNSPTNQFAGIHFCYQFAARDVSQHSERFSHAEEAKRKYQAASCEIFHTRISHMYPLQPTRDGLQPTTAMASNLPAMASNLLEMASNLVATMASNLLHDLRTMSPKRTGK